MDVALDDVYLAARRRIDTRVRALVADGRSAADIPVPGCPVWSVHGVVSHLAGLAVDVPAGRLKGIPDDDWTAGQVADRAGRTTTDVLDEWATHAEAFAAVIAARRVIPGAADALVHEGDIAEALGDPAPPAEHWHAMLQLVCSHMVPAIDRSGSLTVCTASDTWHGGAGGDGPVASVTAQPWELFRGMFSRRSSTQMRAWNWTGDPDPWLARLTVFGLREDDQPQPA